MYHHVLFSDAIIQNIVMGSQRLYPDRRFPDKAIDLLDYVGAHIAHRMDPSFLHVIQETDVEQVMIDLGLAPDESRPRYCVKLNLHPSRKNESFAPLW
jgi:ATP-dependent Clp protease ATP-binding subunit ClpA